MPDYPEQGYVDHLSPLVIVALNTGLRRGELLSLTWGNVDLSRALLTVNGDTAKSGKTRHVPLNSEAAEALQTWRESRPDGQGYVFPNEAGGAHGQRQNRL